MRRKSFTLVEMLVVVGVIAVLAGLLLPALSHARAAGQRNKCVNNHQQIIKAMAVYAAENDGQMIMKNGGHGASDGKGYTYATVLNGIYEGSGTNAYRTKPYVPKEVLVCPLSKEVLVTRENEDDRSLQYLGENAIGIICPLDLQSNAKRGAKVSNEKTDGWLFKSTKADSNLKYYQTMGRFVNVPECDDTTVTFVTDRMKNPAGLVIFADTYREGGRGTSSGQFELFWTFNPRESINSKYYVTLAHQETCVTSLADGHVETMNPGRLRDCGTEIIKFLGDDLKRHHSSDSF